MLPGEVQKQMNIKFSCLKGHILAKKTHVQLKNIQFFVKFWMKNKALEVNLVE